MFGEKPHFQEPKQERPNPQDETFVDLATSEKATSEPNSAKDKNAAASEDKVVVLQESEHKKLLQDMAEARDKYVRILAEFENVRKRGEREKIEFIKYANEELISQFLNVLDDLERSVEAAKANHQDYTEFLKGIEMVMAHIYEMLKKNNVKPLESVGKKFDPHCHEALMQAETDQFDEDVVMEELLKGYLYGDRVVRTAKVKVAKKKEK